MSSGNHVADNGEREYQNRSKCSCGKDDWEVVSWCFENDKECPPEQCHLCEPSEACEDSDLKSRCVRCGEIRELK